jgi:hypothetical protein
MNHQNFLYRMKCTGYLVITVRFVIVV